MIKYFEITIVCIISIYIILKIVVVLGSGIIYSFLNRKYLKTECMDDKIEERSEQYKRRNFIKQAIFNFAHGLNFISNEVVSSIPSHLIRDFIYKHIFKVKMNIGARGAHIYKGVQFRDPFKCYIGDGSIIGDHSILDARGRIKIGKNVNLSSDVKIWTGQHDLNDPRFIYKSAPVKIGDRVWVSSNAIILPGVNIGEGAIVCAGAVVTKNCEEYCIYGGIPAKKIGERNRDLKYEFNEGTLWFY